MGLAAQEPAERIELLNERPIAGPRVELIWRYGSHYHPGAVVVLEGEVFTGQESFQGGVRVQEGDSRDGPRYGQELHFEAAAPNRFRFPICAPATGAALTLTVYRSGGNGEEAEEFVAGLKGKLQLALENERIVLVCGALQLMEGANRFWLRTTVDPAAMPEEDWAYDNIDLVVLSPRAYTGERFSTPARQALRRWILGGGRVLIHNEALASAIRSGLTPVPPDLSLEIGSDFDSWRKAAGLRREDVQRNRGSELVYARFRLGLGGGIFLFPRITPQELAQFRDAIVSSEGLLRPRTGRDERIQSRAFDQFPSGTVSPRRLGRTLWWAALGGSCLIVLLALASTLRSRPLAAGLALGSLALLCAFLARTFPAPEGVGSSIAFRETSADGRATLHREWLHLEGFRNPGALTIQGHPNVTLRAVHLSAEELAHACSTLDSLAPTGAENNAPLLRLRLRPSLPLAPLPLLTASTVLSANPPGGTLGARWALATGQAWHLPPDLAPATLRGVFVDGPAGAVLLRASGERTFLPHPWAGGEGTALRTEPYESAADCIRKGLGGLDKESLEARTRTLEQALLLASRKKADQLVLFGLGTGGSLSDPQLFRLQGARIEQGPHFLTWDLALTAAPAAAP